MFILFGSARANADLLFTLPSDPIQINATTGGTATFTATLTNTFPFALYLNSNSFSIQNPSTLDDTLFQSYFVPASGPPPTLAANGGTLTIDLFQISLPAGTPLGTYSGLLTLQGGADPLAAGDMATSQFAVQAQVPETSGPVCLIAMICLSGAGMLHRRRSARSRSRTVRTPALPHHPLPAD